MAIKSRKVIYQCAVNGLVGHAYTAKGKRVGAMCGKIRMDDTCGAHGNFKCEHKRKGGESCAQ